MSRAFSREERLNTHSGGSNTRLHENISLIQLEDRISLDMILSDALASKYLLTRLSDTVAVVAPGRFDALLARLVRLGHTPKVLEKG
jgi:hypothetical protein